MQLKGVTFHRDEQGTVHIYGLRKFPDGCLMKDVTVLDDMPGEDRPQMLRLHFENLDSPAMDISN